MSRTGPVKKRMISPEPLYQSQLLASLINRIMRSGKKTVAQTQVYQALKVVEEKTKKNPLEVFTQALENIKPTIEVRPRRVGGAAYQIPTPVLGSRRQSLAIRWLIQSARARPNKEFPHFYGKLAAEILDAANGLGGAVKKRQDIHKMADANRAFAHFRW